MKGKISKIKNTKGELALPITTVEAVYLEDGKTKLSDEIKDVLKYEAFDDEGIIAEIPSVIEEIDGIKKDISEINSSLDNKANKNDVAKISNGTPLFASNLADMNDITRNYVNINDGYLYVNNNGYWNKTSVLYQSTGINDNSITPIKINKENQTYYSNNLAIELIPMKYVSPTTGEIMDYTSTSGTTVDDGVTEFIEVGENRVFSYIGYSTESKINGCIYDINKNKIGNLLSPSVAGGVVEMTMPIGAKYIRVNYSRKYKDIFYVKEKFINVKSNIKWLDVDINNLNKNVLDLIVDSQKTISKYKGKKLACLGDSITYGYGLSNPSIEGWVAMLGRELEFAEVKNYGLSGDLIAREVGIAPSMAIRYTTMNDDYDVVIVFGGTNDYYHGKKFGDKSSTDITEFYGALNVLMTGLQTKYLGKEIIFITPMSSYYAGHSSDVLNKNTNKNLKDYRDAIIERCEYYSIPCIDLYSICGMDVAHNVNHKSYYSQDGVHPNIIGNERIKDRIKGFLLTL